MCMRPPRRVNLLVMLLMEAPGARGHPLHVTGPDHTGVAEVVVVRNRTLPRECDRPEAAMRMPADTALALVHRRELARRSVVHEQERTHSLSGHGGVREVG